MKWELIDKSEYLKGLLLLIGKDKKITPEERKYILRIGKVLGFEKKFCENAIDELLENPYISDEPPKFSSEEIAKIFIQDGIRTAMVDKEINPIELEWLKSVAQKNQIQDSWFNNNLEEIIKERSVNLSKNKLLIKK